MRKFKVGDKVRITRAALSDPTLKFAHAFPGERFGTVTSFDPTRPEVCQITWNNEWENQNSPMFDKWHEEWLEPVPHDVDMDSAVKKWEKYFAPVR